MIARTGTRVIAATSLQHIRPIIGARHTTAYYFTTAAAAAASDKTALVIGSSGALGSAVSKHLKDLGMQVLGADVVELPSELTSSQWELDGFCPLPADAHLPELTRQLVRGVNFFLKPQEGFDAIVVASGGWQADPDYADLDPGNEQALEDGALEYAQTIQSMRQKNLDPVLAAGYVAQHYASANSLVVVMGATAALAPTPGMLGYTLAKSASHYMVQSFGAITGKSMESKATRKSGRVARKYLECMDTMTVTAILPTTLDTFANRKAFPNVSWQSWTKPVDVAREIGTWINEPETRPHSGALVRVYPNPDGTGATFELVR